MPPKTRRFFALLLVLAMLAALFCAPVYATPDDAPFEKLKIYTLDEVQEFSSLPVINIDMENGADIERRDKELVQNGVMSVYGSGAPVTGLELTVHGRGNSSWSSVGTGKKSYTVKLSGSFGLLGMEKGKTWCLISNWVDTAYMRNFIAYSCANKLGILAPDCRLCELCVNGKYEGIYMLCQSVQLRSDRVQVKGDGSDADGDGEVESYILEARCDWKTPGFFADRAEIWFHVKDTGSGADPTEKQLNYLADFVNRLNKAIMNGKGYEDMMDVDSFIDFYLMNEVFKNPDFGYGYQNYYSSTFCYMEEGGRLYFGPLWDFDISMGRNCFDNIADEQNRKTMHPDGILSGNTKWVADLMKRPEFAARVKKRWAELSPVLREYIPGLISETDERLTPSVKHDCAVWGGVEGRCTWWNYRTAKGYSQEVRYISDWNQKRLDWLDGYFADLPSEESAKEEQGFFEMLGRFFSSLPEGCAGRGTDN